jgi:hypothetical protein
MRGGNLTLSPLRYSVPQLFYLNWLTMVLTPPLSYAQFMGQFPKTKTSVLFTLLNLFRNNYCFQCPSAKVLYMLFYISLSQILEMIGLKTICLVKNSKKLGLSSANFIPRALTDPSSVLLFLGWSLTLFPAEKPLFCKNFT